MFKEYTVILPQHSDEGDNTTREIEEITLDALDIFGGYTLGALIQGGWLDPETAIAHFDASRPLTIAINPLREDEFFNFVEVCRVKLNQICMYVRLPDGSVQFVP
jgi:hypothetical protein